jgi:hypothetical protein
MTLLEMWTAWTYVSHLVTARPYVGRSRHPARRSAALVSAKYQATSYPSFRCSWR